MPTAPRKTSTHLTRYDIIINSGIPEEDDLEIFLQTCIWARKPKYQTAYDFSRYGIADEYTIYSCDLSSEDLTVLLLKFNGLARAVAQDFNFYRSQDETYKQAFGERYIHCEEARRERATHRFRYFQAM
jgi:hypothetical protein